MVNRQILMADDDADDRFLVQAAFEDNGIPNPVVFFEDGEQLVNYLTDTDNDISPLLILLDLNMPKRDGREVLQMLRGNLVWNAIPIIIFSTSNAPDDVNAAYQLGANCYIIKPSSYEGLKEAVMNIQRFWLHTATLPV
ncbi:response regulator [Dyadobacter psychrotolerans]|uniref:Response regulator n=2 Tax=Dyadobacter psychrotolerans TaxID=2541721 RepID=A0A4R5DWA7_9BACT|nr:response regulator [Dyadobacter psychrotolerans]